MAFKVKAPAGETYFLDKADALYGLEPGEDRTFVIIREATQAEDRQRAGLFAELTRVVDPASNSGKISIMQSLNNDELVEMDLWLTLADTNITDAEGNVLFPFKQIGSVRKVSCSFKEFQGLLGKLPGRVVDEMHEKVAEKNPDWFGPMGED